MGLKQVFVGGAALSLGGTMEIEYGQGGVVAALAGIEGEIPERTWKSGAVAHEAQRAGSEGWWHDFLVGVY